MNDGQDRNVDPKDVAKYRQQASDRAVQEKQQQAKLVKPEKVNLDFARDCEGANEVGDGVLFAHLHRGKFVFVKTSGEWLYWTGHFWQVDMLSTFALGAIENVVDYYLAASAQFSAKADQASRDGNDGQAKKNGKLAQKMRSRVFKLRGSLRPDRVLKFSRNLRDGALSIEGDEIDQKPLLLACLNGVIDVKTGEMHPGRPEDYLMNHADVEFQGLDVECPVYDQAVSDIFKGREELIQYVDRLFGLCLTGLCIEEKLNIFYGRGANGKSVLVHTIEKMLGDFGDPIKSEMLLRQKFANSADKPSSSLMGLRGKRMVNAAEIEEWDVVSLAQIKLLTGADTLKGRHNYGRYDEKFHAEYKIIWLLNDLPYAPSDDGALWRRFLVVPFEQIFSETPQGDELLMDKDLGGKLKKEWSGILARLIRNGLLGEHGYFPLGGLCPPELVVAATDEYRGTDDELGEFLAETCLEDARDDEYETSGNLHRAFMFWQAARGIKRPWTIQKFGKRMTKKGNKSERVGGVPRYWGVKLMPSFNSEVEAAQG